LLFQNGEKRHKSEKEVIAKITGVSTFRLTKRFQGRIYPAATRYGP